MIFPATNAAAHQRLYLGFISHNDSNTYMKYTRTHAAQPGRTLTSTRRIPRPRRTLHLLDPSHLARHTPLLGNTPEHGYIHRLLLQNNTHGLL